MIPSVRILPYDLILNWDVSCGSYSFKLHSLFSKGSSKPFKPWSSFGSVKYRAFWELEIYCRQLICTREDVAWWPHPDSSVHQAFSEAKFLCFSGKTEDGSFTFCLSISYSFNSVSIISYTELKCAMSKEAVGRFHSHNSPILPSHHCPPVQSRCVCWVMCVFSWSL